MLYAVVLGGPLAVFAASDYLCDALADSRGLCALKIGIELMEPSAGPYDAIYAEVNCPRQLAEAVRLGRSQTAPTILFIDGKRVTDYKRLLYGAVPLVIDVARAAGPGVYQSMWDAPSMEAVAHFAACFSNTMAALEQSYQALLARRRRHLAPDAPD